MSEFLSFVYKQLFITLPYPSQSYAGKTIIVTGSNTGLGKEAATHFTRLGASTVILAVRSIEKGNAAKADIEAKTGVKNVVKVFQLDMSSYQSVRDFAAKVEKEVPRLDIAILNAGVARGDFELVEKDETDITVNVVTTFLLALLLLPKLKETAGKFNVRPTLTIITSEVHGHAVFVEKDAPVLFDRLAENGENVMEDRYNVSKLLQVLGVRAMVERKPASQIPVTINLAQPGLCKSELARESGWGLAIMKFLLARTTEMGSRTLVHAGSQGVETHGAYLDSCKIMDPSPFVRSKEGHDSQEKMWKELEVKLEAIHPGVTKNL